MPGRLKGFFLVLILLMPFSIPMEGESPWWRMDVIVIVKGEYSLAMGDLHWSADYSCKLRGRSVLEADGEDYLLYSVDMGPGTAEDLVWVEFMEGAGQRQVFHCENRVRPRLDIRFALREGNRVKIGLEVCADIAPFQSSGSPFVLQLPRTSTGIQDAGEKAYDRGIRRGGNILEWNRESMDSTGEVKGVLRWEWGETPGAWSHQHSVSVTFQVARGGRDSN